MRGSAVAYRLLRHGRFHVRAMTRDPQGVRAQGLRAAGAEIVQGELDEGASLVACMAGATGVFGVVNVSIS